VVLSPVGSIPVKVGAEYLVATPEEIVAILVPTDVMSIEEIEEKAEVHPSEETGWLPGIVDKADPDMESKTEHSILHLPSVQ